MFEVGMQDGYTLFSSVGRKIAVYTTRLLRKPGAALTSRVPEYKYIAIYK